MLGSISSVPDFMPDVTVILALGALVLISVFSALTVCAALLALFGNSERALRAQAVLACLLDVVRAALRFGSGDR